LFLASGVTTVFNLRGGPEQLRWRQLINSGQMVAPNLYTAGDFVDAPRIRSSDEAEREVLHQIHDGYDIIKIHEIEDSDFHVTTTIGLARPVYNRVLETSRAQHIPLVGHIPNELGLDAALNGGQNLAHIVMYILAYFMPLHTKAFRHFVIIGLAGLGGLVVSSILLLLSGLIARFRHRAQLMPAHNGEPRRTAVPLIILATLLTLVYSSVQWLGSDLLIITQTACAIVIWCLVLLLIIRTFELWRGPRPGLYRTINLSMFCLAAVVFAVSLSYFVPLCWRSTTLGMRSIAQRSADAKIAVMTTLVVDYVHEMADDPELLHLSEAARKDWGITDGSIKSQSLMDRLLAPHVRRFEEKMAGELYRAGVPLLLGTDTFGYPGVAPGISVHKELRLLNEAGLSPYDALRTATANPATSLRQPLNFGQIVVGQRADLLLVDGNPLQDLTALGRLRGVVLRGQWIDASRLTKSATALND